MKFSSEFDIFANNTKNSCDNVLYIDDERLHQWLDYRYCNNNKPPLDVWIPHSADSNRFIFWFELSSKLSATAEANGFHLEYSGKQEHKAFNISYIMYYLNSDTPLFFLVHSLLYSIDAAKCIRMSPLFLF